MTREEIIKNAAHEYITTDKTCGVGVRTQAFIDGAKWADKHPSEELISKLYSVSIAVYKQLGKPDKEAIEYIKNHLKL